MPSRKPKQKPRPSRRKTAPPPPSRPSQAALRNRLAAIVESSDDAIISKSLDGIIDSWNRGAERIFGWSARAAVGKPLTLIIPPQLLHEERDIIPPPRRGERIEHYETVRVAKDGHRIDVSLTISPVRGLHG